ncbi:MAG TPA: hypothetical protein PK938_07590, partial [Bacteroidaceae bacterium]|nr:hypothetical protein [Bacteroidaceae bacterium]
MKQTNKFKMIAVMAVSLVMALFVTSCSNDDFFSMDYDNPNLSFKSFISVNDIKTGPSTTFEKEQFKEAAYRFSCRLFFEKDNTISLIEGTTADELKISANLFELFNEVIDLWNENPTALIIKKNKAPRTKGGDPESTSTRGGNVFYDLAATSIYNI